MEDERYIKQILKYGSKWGWDLGRPLKRWTDKLQKFVTGTCQET